MWHLIMYRDNYLYLYLIVKPGDTNHFHADVIRLIIWFIYCLCYDRRLEPGYLSGIALGYGLDDRGFDSR
jgi:hypothetical protein